MALVPGASTRGSRQIRSELIAHTILVLVTVIVLGSFEYALDQLFVDSLASEREKGLERDPEHWDGVF